MEEAADDDFMGKYLLNQYVGNGLALKKPQMQLLGSICFV